MILPHDANPGRINFRKDKFHRCNFRAALQATRRRKPKRLVLAVPVAPTDRSSALRSDADDVVCLEDHEFFGAIRTLLRDFRQDSDEEVIKILERFPVQVSLKAQQPAA